MIKSHNRPEERQYPGMISLYRETIEMYKLLNNLNRGKGEQLSLYLSATVPVKGEAAWLNG